MSSLLLAMDWKETFLLPEIRRIEGLMLATSDAGQVYLHPSQMFPDPEKKEREKTPEVLITTRRILEGEGTISDVYQNLGKGGEGSMIDERLLDFCRMYPAKVKNKNVFRTSEKEVVFIYADQSGLIATEKHSMEEITKFSKKDGLLFRIPLRVI